MKKTLLKRENKQVGKLFCTFIDVVLSVFDNDNQTNFVEELEISDIPGWEEFYFRPRIPKQLDELHQENFPIPIDKLLNGNLSEESITEIDQLLEEAASYAKAGKVVRSDLISGMLSVIGEQEVESGKQPLDVLITLHTIINSMASVILYRKPIYLLYDDARNGNDNAFFKMVSLDKSMIATDWANSRVRKATIDGDWVFFDKLSRALIKKPYDKKKRIKLAAMILFFWDFGFKELDYLECVEYLQAVGFEVEEIPEQDALRKMIYRLQIPDLNNQISNYESL